MTPYELEPGSFRDRYGRVFYRGGEIYRALSAPALRDWEALLATTLFRRFVAAGAIVRTERIDQGTAGFEPPPGEWAAVLKHETIPFVSYPYEWCFGMLKDAALLHLVLLQAALAEGMTLKDASPYNIQWVGAQPCFIDILSFERLAPREPWTGYRQFCQLFLYPLFLQAYKDVPFHPWLRGCIEGIAPGHLSRLMSNRDLLRPGVFTHVYLQALAQARYGSTQRNIKDELRAAGFNKTLIEANVRRLATLIGHLRWNGRASVWSEYAHTGPYSPSDQEQKAAFIHNVVVSRPWNLVWDLGCNTGTFARIAAQNASQVVAMDADPVVVERLYQALKSEGKRTIIPLVINLADASPNLGWRGLERKALTARGTPDLIVCVGLIHHLVIGANIPLRDCISWLASLEGVLIIEFVTKDDSMVQGLLRHKTDIYSDYELANFEECLSQLYTITRRAPLSCGTRILYVAEPRVASSRSGRDPVDGVARA